jgi:lysophospholipase L1-like esterase
MRIRTTFVVLAGTIVAAFLAPATPAQTPVERPDPARWEATIQAWESEDGSAPPPTGAIVFTGSSSIRLWNTVHEDMSPLTIIDRGFGGSWMQDAAYYAERIVNAYEPRAVVLYEGDNDVGQARLSPDALLADFREFVRRVHADMPEARIYFLSIKPSVLRWDNWDLMKEANTRIREETESDDRLIFIDVATPMLGPDGGPPSEDLFIADMLHMTPRGYAIWTDAVRPVLVEREGRYER